MIRLHRRVSLPRLGALREFIGLRQPGLRVYAMRLEGMNFEATRFRSAHPHLGFANDLTLVTAGQWVDRRAQERVLGAGEFVVGPAPTSLNDHWRAGARLITIEWDTPRADAVRYAKASPRTVEAARTFAAALEPRQPTASREMLDALSNLFDALRDDGAPLPTLRPEEPPAQAVRAAAVLNRALTQLGDAPMWVDFCADRSERQSRRDLCTAADWVGLIGGSLRSTLNAIRLNFAVSLLDVPSASLAEIATALGYGSEKSLRQALRRASISSTRG